MLDIALIVPFQPRATSWVDPVVRGSQAAAKLVAIRSRDRFFEFLGFEPMGGAPNGWRQRSLTAIALSTSLERAGLAWRTLDPGGVSLHEWRRRLAALAAERPRVVAISSTFVNDGFWLASLCAVARDVLPDAQIAVGGYYYATAAKEFLSLDADVLCVGEGEVRIVEIAQAIRDGRSLDHIPGLYLRDKRGSLRYTGDVEPLSLDALPLPDWSLSTRIEPPFDLDQVPIVHQVETQRGCIFKCEFCTFRTLAAPVLGSVDRAVAVIMDAGRGRGTIWVVDGTATYPRDRWRRILERLADLGGSPLPIHAYARVNDLDEDVCALMARANVNYVLIGQESGDQGILNAIRKGTRVDQLRPAIAMLGRHGIEPALSFIFGFPGETEATLATTRRLIASLNDGHESRPVVRHVNVEAFAAQDFAGVHQRGALNGEVHRYGWSHLAISPARAADEALLTYVELSRIPHAPTTAFNGIVLAGALYGGPRGGDDLPFFRFSKAIDRGIGIFATEELEGRRPDMRELRRLREEIVASVSPAVREPKVWRKLMTHANNRATWLVMREWVREKGSNVGPLTRLALGLEVARVTGRTGRVVEALKSGRYPEIGYVAPGDVEPRRQAAEKLVKLGMATGARRLVRPD